MPKTLINASNLHVGGGVQVATSFLYELSQIPKKASQLSVLVSTQVDRNLRSIACDTSCFSSYVVFDVSGASVCKTDADRLMDRYDQVFTIFGPLYRWSPAFKSIVGFAQAWILYPNSQAWSFLSPMARLKSRLKLWIQVKFFQRADKIVVELEHAKDRLVQHTNIQADNIIITHNCLANVYQTPNIWQDICLPDTACDIKLGFLGRNYLHKNVKIFKETAHILARDYGLTARLFVTFTDDEWVTCSEELQAVCINVGPLTVAQCPSFYSQIDAVFFPSLLECFSATPLEAMAMQKYIFASDMQFNRDICKEFASYFDALNPKAAAQAIDAWYHLPVNFDLKMAKKYAVEFSTPQHRASQYLALLNSE